MKRAADDQASKKEGGPPRRDQSDPDNTSEPSQEQEGEKRIFAYSIPMRWIVTKALGLC